MRFSQRRHFALLDKSGHAQKKTFARALSEQPAASTLELELSPRDYVIFLLCSDAEIEHALMVQYLYAAYSLGGPQVPPEHRERVRAWQEVLLGIAKEEMGHFLSVQNVLRLIGAPVHLEREDYPWSTLFYPFPFELEPLTLDSLAKYVYCESPENWGPHREELKADITARVQKATPTPHRVGELFDELLAKMGDPTYLPESVFQGDTSTFQATRDEWSRGYVGGQRGNKAKLCPHATPDVIVKPLWSRGEAMDALMAIKEQGEAPTLKGPEELSHFVRFLRVYEDMKLHAVGWEPSRRVAVNPYVALSPDTERGNEAAVEKSIASPITNPEAQLWAQLHNVRYRMLLSYLQHSYYLEGKTFGGEIRSPRGTLINATFGEMYNLRAISEILMELPLGIGGHTDGVMAGPPFQMPYTLQLPLLEVNRWLGHADLLEASTQIVERLLHVAPQERKRYLLSLREADAQMGELAQRIIKFHAEPRSL